MYSAILEHDSPSELENCILCRRVFMQDIQDIFIVDSIKLGICVFVHSLSFTEDQHAFFVLLYAKIAPSVSGSIM